MHRSHTKSFLRSMSVAAVAVVAVVATACSGSPGDPGTSNAPTGAASANGTIATPASGGSITVGGFFSMTTLKPLPAGASSAYLYNLIYDTPVTISDGKAQPGLVTAWKSSPDGTSMTLTLRSGVTNSDGTPFDAKALVWNINWYKDPTNASHALALWQKVTATAVNPTTVKLAFAQPMPAILAMLAQSPIVKPNAPDSGVGTGPFKVENFTAGTSLTAVRNPHYWRSGEPHLDKITVTEYKDPSSLVLALKSGTIDVLLNPALSAVAGLKSSGKKVLNTNTASFYAMTVNTSKAPLNNPKVRQALSLAFNRPAFTKTTMFGLGQPLYSVFPPAFTPYYDKAIDSGSFDLDKAKQLLTEAGVHNLTIEVDSPNVLAQNTFLPVYKQDLAKIGVTLNIKTIDVATWAKIAPAGSFPGLLTQAYGAFDYDPATFLNQVNFRPEKNSEHFSSADYTRMVQDASIATDPAKRLADYQAIAKYLKQQAFIIPLATIPALNAYSSKITGMRAGFVGLPDWAGVGLAK